MANYAAATNATSHPTRGAWIEITQTERTVIDNGVAPHTGCVD